jgi:hypothetical protein
LRSGFLAWVLPALLILVMAAAVLQPIRSYDLGWHLAAGRLILERGAIPAEDPFSFTRPGTAWLDHEWLFQVAAFLLFRSGGWRALLGLDLLLALVAGSCLIRWMRAEQVGDATGAILLALSFAGARFRFDARPEMASLCFTVILLSILHARRRGGQGRRAWLLPPLFLVWANTHPGVVLGAAVVMLWVAGEWGQGLLEGRGIPHPVSRTALCLISPLLLLANPGGWNLLRVPWEIRRIVMSGHAPNLEWASPSMKQFPLFSFSIAAAVVVIGLGFRKIDLPAVLVAAVIALLACQHLRNVGLFFLVLPPAMARPLASLERRVRFPVREGSILAMVLLALLSAHFLRENLLTGKRGFLDSAQPRRAVDLLESRGAGRRLFNDVLFGGYLIWRRYPEHGVFIDGRNEVYDSLLAEIFEAVNSGEKWKALLDRYEIDAALLRRGQMQMAQYPPASPGGVALTELRAFSASHFPSAEWSLVHWDDQSLLFVRRNDPAAKSLVAEEYRVNPDDVPHTLARIARGELDRKTVLEEIDRKLLEDPQCFSARGLRDAFGRVPPRSKGTP